MKVHYSADNLPLFHRAAVTSGSFDGVHLGHQKIIRSLIEEADGRSGESVIITFDPHPRNILHPAEPPLQFLQTVSEKIAALEKCGVDHLVIIPFTKEFSQLSAQDYVRNFLVEKFHPASVVVGYNHHFGHHRDGNVELMRKLGNELGFSVFEISKQLTEDIEISSTRIRVAISEGDILTANRLLGYSYSITGTVIHGDERGRKIGFPTANIQLNSQGKVLPIQGVYVVNAAMNAAEIRGMMNIGIRPTFNETQLSLEVHLLDWSGDLYGRDISVRFLARIRDEKKFDSVEELVKQLMKDKFQSAAFRTD